MKYVKIHQVVFINVTPDYFMKEMGHFADVFAGLEDMNKAVINSLIQTAKVLAQTWSDMNAWVDLFICLSLLLAYCTLFAFFYFVWKH